MSRRRRIRALLLVSALAALAICCASAAAAAAAARPGSEATTRAGPTATGSSSAAARTAATGSSTLTNPEEPIPVEASDTPPVGRFLSADRVLEIANRLPKLRRARAQFPGSYGGAYIKGPPTATRWQVSYFSKQGKEIAQAIVADRTGKVLEQWTGFQIAWSMARGYPGAFGRHVNALYVWLPLCFLFFVAFFDWRRPLRLLHLDLLALLSFSVSLAFFNHGRIGVSTPAAYPPLLYLLARMLIVGRVRLRAGPPLRPPAVPAAGPASPEQHERAPAWRDGHEPAAGPAGLAPAPSERAVRLLIPPPWLAVMLMFLIGFRIALNVTDSNAIDVGYAGVIGAQRIVDGRPLYGGYPADNEHGDTYGPVSYEVYVPFEQALGWSGRWDDLPAAHAAAIVFDLLAIALLFALGHRIRGPSMGIALAYAWASYPFTLFALESNSNDTLVAVLVLAALLAACSPPPLSCRWARRSVGGAFAALAGLAKFAPLALAPLLCTHGLRGRPRPAQARAALVFCAAFALTAAVVAIPALAHDTLHTIYERTLVYQSHRESPFSIWGLYGTSPTGAPYAHWLGPAQVAVEIAAIALALALALLPRRGDVVGLAACAAAVLIAVQLGIDHWFYLYVPWFFGLAMLALLGEFNWAPAHPTHPAPAPQGGRTVTSGRPAAASAPARSNRLAAA
jgi:hypothetical protein